MFILAVTGSIGSGKSTVCGFLKQMGAQVISADELARDVLSPSSSALKELVSSFGDDILTVHGGVDRHKLARIVFKDASARSRLEAITHPEIFKQFASISEKMRKSGVELLVYDIPLYFETKSASLKYGCPLANAVLVVAANETNCIDRASERDRTTKSDVQLRLDSQLPLSEKISQADYVILNDGGLAELEVETRKIYDKIVSTLKTRPV